MRRPTAPPEELNSLEYWFPRVKDAAPVPRTEIVRWAGGEDGLLDLLDGKTPPQFHDLIQQLHAGGDRVGWPCFLRTGYGSGKHEWGRTCFVAGPEQLARNVCGLVEWTILVDIMARDRLSTWIVRELLPTVAPFSAFDGLPIAREQRWWIQGFEVVGHHPYWPPDAISYGVSVERWHDLLPIVNFEPPDEMHLLRDRTEKVARAMGGEGAWSVDWLYALNPPRWVLIDMAVAEHSFCWEDYPTAPSQQQRLWAPAPRNTKPSDFLS